MYPSDQFGCGHYRLIYPARVLKENGYDVTIVNPEERNIAITKTDGVIQHVTYPQDADVMVFQRVTHNDLVPTIAWLRAHGVTIVTDIDDDLTTIHPDNYVWGAYHPKSVHNHSWNNPGKAASIASLTTVSTPALLARYASGGNGVVLPNCIPGSALEIERNRRSDRVIGWPGSLHSHPDDPQVVRHALRRIVDEGATFQMVGNSDGCGNAFGLQSDPEGTGSVEFKDWMKQIADRIGIGIAPLAETKFNEAKSWLKILEMSALGIPFVAADLPEYRKFVHAAGIPSWCLARKPRHWYQALLRLWGEEDQALRRTVGEHAREHAARWTIERHAHKWLEAWTEARERDLQNMDKIFMKA